MLEEATMHIDSGNRRNVTFEIYKEQISYDSYEGN